MALVQDSKQKEKDMRLEMPARYSLKVIGRGSVNKLILANAPKRLIQKWSIMDAPQ